MFPSRSDCSRFAVRSEALWRQACRLRRRPQSECLFSANGAPSLSLRLRRASPYSELTRGRFGRARLRRAAEPFAGSSYRGHPRNRRLSAYRVLSFGGLFFPGIWALFLGISRSCTRTLLNTIRGHTGRFKGRRVRCADSEATAIATTTSPGRERGRLKGSRRPSWRWRVGRARCGRSKILQWRRGCADAFETDFWER